MPSFAIASMPEPLNPAERAAALLLRARDEAGRIVFVSYAKTLTHRLRWRWRFDPSDAEEVASDAVQQFVANPPTASPAEAWLFTLLRQAAINRLRHQGADIRQPGAPLESLSARMGSDDAPFDAPSNLDLAELVALRDAISKGMDRMAEEDPVYVAIIVLAVEGYTNAEIGQALGISPNAAKDRVHRARKAARKHFKDCL